MVLTFYHFSVLESSLKQGYFNAHFPKLLAGPTGFEPAVFSVTGRRVNRATPRTRGGWGGFRTHYLGLMSPTLYQLSYPAERSAPADLQSTPHLYKIIMFSWLRGWDSNPQSQGYEPCEMPFLYPASKHLKNRYPDFLMSPQKSKSCS